MVNWGPIEICFVVDLGDTMSKWVEILKKQLVPQVQKFVDNCRGYVKVKVALVGYRTNLDCQPFVVIDFTTNLLQFDQKLKQIKTYGAHQCKSMRDALEYAINLDWKNYAGGTLILIADSPPYGIKYHDQTIHDIYPSVNPPGIPIEMLIERLAFRGIHIVIFQMHDSMDIVVNLMEKAYNKTKRVYRNQLTIFNKIRTENQFNNELLDQIYKHLLTILNGN